MEDVVEHLRSSDRFDTLVEEIAERFHDEDYRNKRLPEIKSEFREDAVNAGLSEESADSVAEDVKNALMG
jgi:hypothetical protein